MTDYRANEAVDEESWRDSPFEVAMRTWVNWMRLADQQSTSGDSNLQDTKDFMRAGEAISVMVGDLPRVNWWAIMKSRGICTAWIFPESNFADAMALAEEILTKKMQTHIATRRFFD